jgi:hypothetical protein
MKSHHQLKTAKLHDPDRSVISQDDRSAFDSQISPLKNGRNLAGSILTQYQQKAADFAREQIKSQGASRNERRSHDTTTQAKLDAVRRQLRTQGNGRAMRTRQEGLDMPNTQGGWQVGLVDAGLGEMPLNHFRDASEPKVNPLTKTR